MSLKLNNFLADHQQETPFLVVDLEIVRSQYLRLVNQFPSASIYYAIKANPAPELLSILKELGSCFDVASLQEVQMCLDVGISADRISYGSTIKKAKHIASAFEHGVTLYSFDSLEELKKVARHAPGSRVCCRILVETTGAEWSLARKFGCDREMAYDLLKLSAQLGLKPHGLSFHVGSQQTDPTQWRQPIQDAADLWAQLKAAGIDLHLLNIGGGMPAQYRHATLPDTAYSQAIHDAIASAFGDALPELMLEPGRSLVGDAGIIQTEVVLISQKSRHEDQRWVYLDIGKFGGLIETLDEAIKYRIQTPHDGQITGPVVLAGPTCDSADVLYEKAGYELPLGLQIGDRIEILSTGAYTTTYSSVAFNGFEPLRAYYI